MRTSEIFYFSKFFRKYNRRYLGGIASLIALNLLINLLPLLIKFSLDEISTKHDFNTIWYAVLLYIAASFVIVILRYIWRILFMNTSHLIGYDIREEVFDFLMKRPVSYFGSAKVGELMSKMTNDINSVRMAFGPGMLILIDGILNFFIIIPLMFYLSFDLSVLAFILLPFLPFFVKKMSGSIKKYFEEVQESFSRISGRVQENITNIREVKSYSLEEKETLEIEKLSTDFFKLNMKLAVVQSLFHPFLDFIVNLGIFVVLLIGGYYVISENISIGTFVAFIRYIVELSWPMIAMGWAVSLFQQGSASSKRIKEIFDSTLPQEILEKGLTPSALKESIKIQDLSFGFNDHPIFKNISLEIPYGKKIGITGPTASGKTTFCDLLVKIHEKYTGNIFIGDNNLKELSLSAIRKSIGYVTQDIFLFSATLQENIKFGLQEKVHPAVTLEEITKIIAFDEEVKSFRKGYNTVIGERGINLSGGQKQRVQLARVLMRNFDILLFDDTFSSVDADTETEILKNLEPLLKTKTVLFVSNRISTLSRCDEIIVLKDGRIDETGTHAELILKEGYYSNIYQMQKLIRDIDQYGS